MILTAILVPAPEGGFTVFNPETGTTTQGESVEEALENLRKATELYLEEFPLATTRTAFGYDISREACLIFRAFRVPRLFGRLSA